MSLCTYCGIVADTVDHTVPRHLLQRAGDLGVDLSTVIRIRKWTVPACRECNSTLGGRIFPTLVERRAAAKAHIRKSYASFLRTPDWTEAELAEVGEKTRRDIVYALAMREWTRARLRWNGWSGTELEAETHIEAVYALSLTVARKSA